ncbi:NUDIX hydrolase [Psychromicrobium xiongbiense]|uniref:NUDIX hydrolase n=1 Tax=Psychromicrobium xiongbiense TaxID=3051184 RepID=UPI003075D3F1
MSSTSSNPSSAAGGGALKRRFQLWQDEVDSAHIWVEQGGRTPAKARYASAMVLLRDSSRGPETFLTYRRNYSPLGTVTFPGGSLEENDDAEVDWVGPSPAQWAKALGLEDDVLARRHVVAAIRETFEETGVLLAGSNANTVIDVTPSAEWTRKRQMMAEQELAMPELLAKRGLALRTDLLKPLLYWISPDFAHRRFKTRYFAAPVPSNQTATPLDRVDGQHRWADWVCPSRLVAERDTTALGDAVGAGNTVGRTLGELVSSGCDLILNKIASSSGCIAYLNHKRPLLAYQPHLVVDGDEYWLEVDATNASDASCRER